MYLQYIIFVTLQISCIKGSLFRIIKFVITWTRVELLLFHLHPTVSTDYCNKLYNLTHYRRWAVTLSPSAAPARQGTGNAATTGFHRLWCRAAIWTTDNQLGHERRTQSTRFVVEIASSWHQLAFVRPKFCRFLCCKNCNKLFAIQNFV